MNILGKSQVTYQQCETWLKGVKNANKIAHQNLPLLWESAVNNGIVPEILIAQAMVETGYFNFGGVLNASFHNTCGLKTTKGGSNYAANAHMRFKSWEEGIQAHADHLALYAGAPKFPRYSPNCASHTNDNYKYNGTTKDPRHFPYLYGKCKTVEGLTGTWATSRGYAESIIKIVNQIRNCKNDVSNTSINNNKYANGDYNKKAKVVASVLNVRAGRPGDPDYKKIYGTLKRGTVVTVWYCLNNWFSITYKGKTAFISGDYVELQ